MHDDSGSKSQWWIDFQRCACDFLAGFCFSGTTCLQSWPATFQQRSFGDHQITQRTGNEQAMSIFTQPAISHLRESKLTFDDAELVLHFGSDPRLVSVLGALFISQITVAAALRLGEIPGSWRIVSDRLLLPSVRGVTPDSGFLAMEQVRQYLGIVDIGRCGDNGVDKLSPTVDTDVRLHAEVPLIALAGLPHLRIALFLFILGGTRRADDAGIDNGTSGYLQAILLQILIHQVEQLITQVVFLHQVAELADRGFVRHRLPTEVDADELAQRTGVIESFLGRRIRQVEPVLDEVDPQHALDTDRAPTGALRLGIERLDSRGQFLPGNDGFHFFQELFFASLLPVFLESGIGKGVLAHEVQLVLGTGPIINEHRN